MGARDLGQVLQNSWSYTIWTSFFSPSLGSLLLHLRFFMLYLLPDIISTARYAANSADKFGNPLPGPILHLVRDVIGQGAGDHILLLLSIWNQMIIIMSHMNIFIRIKLLDCLKYMYECILHVLITLYIYNAHVNRCLTLETKKSESL